ncbi:hypothetical protein LTR37_001577 [Vermiconidia calcicola]|uniref:Uncharacterized protein n=1 Tax=Vermiconidia calcicola TaxID=1690605 RepID=A0ACC3NXZ3_9PEZI|nr:hypothetical protein LTR37_001577 [Vermiconidia calcicola]
MDILQSAVFWWGYGCSGSKRLAYLETSKICKSIHEAAEEALWEFYTSRCVIVCLNDRAGKAFIEVQCKSWDKDREQDLLAILNRQISALVKTPIAEVQVIVTTHDKEAHPGLLATIDAALISLERNTDGNIKKSISVDLLQGNTFHYNRSILAKGRSLYI